jgi:prophage tail gpP-like protein
VALSGELVLTGYIDRYMPAYDKHQHRVRIVGRPKTEDLVDLVSCFPPGAGSRA